MRKSRESSAIETMSESFWSDHGLERFPIRWNHLIERESLKFKELEHVLIEKAGQLFRNML